MPTYNYKCENCGDLFSAIQKMSESPLLDCNICDGRVRRIISGGAGIIFKGSGFYHTDYVKNKSGDNSNKSLDKKESKSKKTEKENKLKGKINGKN